LSEIIISRFLFGIVMYVEVENTLTGTEFVVLIKSTTRKIKPSRSMTQGSDRELLELAGPPNLINYLHCIIQLEVSNLF
jgi:hypothetical protein